MFDQIRWMSRAPYAERRDGRIKAEVCVLHCSIVRCDKAR